ncbi:hypothetical protein G7046_g9287 [Stylonectria norvegica]|nr:hypothetical protein G7046_g9287 [Stylonectria norvegica]
MASRTIIPRFLLPLQGPLWHGVRIPLSQNICVRFVSNKKSSSGGSKPEKIIVLEKPAKFNPPSHGSRLRSKNAMPRHYGPELTPDEVAVQGVKNYPGTMAPEGSWAHWFWHSRLLHTFITMGTLLALGVLTFFMNYAYNSPFKELVPPLSDLRNHPFYFFMAWKNVIVMHERDKAAKAVDHRTRHVDDVAKRRYFMKMHGIETKDPITMIFGKGEEEEKPEGEHDASPLAKDVPEKAVEPAEPKKKWFGIF